MQLELLAPAGDRDALTAAVQCGANAVYLGAKGFNARRKAGNFDEIGLEEAVEYCHLRGVRVYVALNTLVRGDELSAFEETLDGVAKSRADAVIVQDLGVAAAVRRYAPHMELHASTQLAVHNRQGVDFLAENGFDRVVLAREMTYDQIRQCSGRGVRLEAFVHGALCVSCSGQCLFSSMVGGRSGNRGACAQPCRLPYKYGQRTGYLLSPKDLMLFDQLKEMREAGIESLKIEGRLKRAEYVAVTTDVYRRAIDRMGAHPAVREDAEALRQMFSRGGFTTGYIGGLRDSDLIYPAQPNHAGFPVGKCERDGYVRLSRDVEAADVLALRRGASGEGRPTKLAGRAGSAVACGGAKRGDELIRMVSDAQMRQAGEMIRSDRRRAPVSAALKLRIGQPIELKLTCEGKTAAVCGEVAERAQSRPIDAERAAAQVAKSGGTAYDIREVSVDLDENVFIPASALNALRRDGLSALSAARLGGLDANISGVPLRLEIPRIPSQTYASIALKAQSADAKVLLRALASGADEIVFAPEDLRISALNAAIEMLKGQDFFLALPQVADAQVLDALYEWAMQNAQYIKGVYLTNAAHLSMRWPGEVIADYPLNIANSLSLQAALDAGASAYVPSIELTAGQIAALGGAREIIAYGKIPLMQLRHCPLRASDPGAKGGHAACRLCDHCPAEDRMDANPLTDRRGIAFPLRRIASDSGCVVQVLNSVPLMLLRHADRLPAARAWRMLLDADDPTEYITRAHRTTLAGGDARTYENWDIIDKMETTTGHYFRGVD